MPDSLTSGPPAPQTEHDSRETILVVDDTEQVRDLVVAVLKKANYRVLSADCGESALRLAAATDVRIDLLLSDVEMGAISGPDLGEQLKKARPLLHVMLMSGGATGNLLVLNYGWAFIQKPFLSKKLVQMVADVLGSPNRAQAGGQEFDSRKDKHPDAKQDVESAGP